MKKQKTEIKGKLLKCSCCTYTMQESCPECGKKTHGAEPAKFSPSDKYGRYRRKTLYS